MKYLCMLYTDESNPVVLTDRDQKDLIEEHLAYDEELKQSGHLVAAQALASPRAATTLKVRDNRLSITDGPFIETKDILTGFFLVQAKDLNEAIRLAAKIPSARYGFVEIRPVRELLGQGG